MKRIVFTVTNQLSYDQRMIRICTSLAAAGYSVTLAGVHRSGSPLTAQPFRQRRFWVPFRRGFLFYAAYNIRLFFYLLFVRCDVLCCIDLDTLLPVYFAGRLRGRPVVYDAHEYFTQQKEVLARPGVYRVWHWIERRFVPRIKHGYTVSHSIAAAFAEKYGVQYGVIMNCTVLKPAKQPPVKQPHLLYQGAVNEARGLEQLIPAMKQLALSLYIYGDGNFMQQCRTLIETHGLQHKVFMMGKLLPAALDDVTAGAWLGLNLVENTGLNQYYSLANKFFDYMHHAVPQITMDFPEYRHINSRFEVALLIPDTGEQNIIKAVNTMLENKELYNKLQQNCLAAREVYNWQAEEKKLLAFYSILTGGNRQ